MLFSIGSLLLNLVMGITKLIIAIFIKSYYIGMNGIYNMILFFSKNSAVRKLNTIDKMQDVKLKNNVETRTCYHLCIYSGTATFVYLNMSIILTFFLQEHTHYSLIIAIYLSVVGFGKLIAGIIGALKTRKDANIVIHYIKYANLVDACISIGLIQRAILMAMEIQNANFYSGIGGIIFSIIALLIALYMVLELAGIKKRKYKNV